MTKTFAFHVVSLLLFASFLSFSVFSVAAQETSENDKFKTASVFNNGSLITGGLENKNRFYRYSKIDHPLLLHQAQNLTTGIQQQNNQKLKQQLNLRLKSEQDRWAQTRKTLERSTLAGLWITGSVGTIVALNRPTLLGEGRCRTGNPVFGDYGCGELSTVHGISAAATIALYTASEIFELTTGPEQWRSKKNRTFTWIHRIGMIALPLAGIIARYPEVIGINEPSSQDDFSKTLRTIHIGVGYATVLSYTVTFSLD